MKKTLNFKQILTLLTLCFVFFLIPIVLPLQGVSAANCIVGPLQIEQNGTVTNQVAVNQEAIFTMTLTGCNRDDPFRIDFQEGPTACNKGDFLDLDDPDGNDVFVSKNVTYLPGEETPAGQTCRYEQEDTGASVSFTVGGVGTGKISPYTTFDTTKSPQLVEQYITAGRPSVWDQCEDGYQNVINIKNGLGTNIDVYSCVDDSVKARYDSCQNEDLRHKYDTTPQCFSGVTSINANKCEFTFDGATGPQVDYSSYVCESGQYACMSGTTGKCQQIPSPVLTIPLIQLAPQIIGSVPEITKDTPLTFVVDRCMTPGEEVRIMREEEDGDKKLFGKKIEDSQLRKPFSISSQTLEPGTYKVHAECNDSKKSATQTFTVVQYPSSARAIQIFFLEPLYWGTEHALTIEHLPNMNTNYTLTFEKVGAQSGFDNPWARVEFETKKDQATCDTDFPGYNAHQNPIIELDSGNCAYDSSDKSNLLFAAPVFLRKGFFPMPFPDGKWTLKLTSDILEQPINKDFTVTWNPDIKIIFDPKDIVEDTPVTINATGCTGAVSFRWWKTSSKPIYDALHYEQEGDAEEHVETGSFTKDNFSKGKYLMTATCDSDSSQVGGQAFDVISEDELPTYCYYCEADSDYTFYNGQGACCSNSQCAISKAVQTAIENGVAPDQAEIDKLYKEAIIEKCEGGATCTPGKGCNFINPDAGPPPCVQGIDKDGNPTENLEGYFDVNGRIKEGEEDTVKKLQDKIVRCTKTFTAIGSINTELPSLVASILGILLSISGMIALYFILRSGYQVMMSQGNPEALQEARERITSAIIGLLFIIFSLVILQVIGVDILKIPGFE